MTLRFSPSVHGVAWNRYRCFLYLPTAMAVTACSQSPSRNVLGSSFPTWMICALLGIVLTALARLALVRLGIDAALPAPAIVYLSMATAATLAIWLFWLS
jgi:hypothetical protein